MHLDIDLKELPAIALFIGLRENLSPAITATATLMMGLSILLLLVANVLSRRRR